MDVISRGDWMNALSSASCMDALSRGGWMDALSRLLGWKR